MLCVHVCMVLNYCSIMLLCTHVGTKSRKGTLYTYVHCEKKEFKVHLYLTHIL